MGYSALLLAAESKDCVSWSDPEFNEAEQFFSAALYQKAIPIYQKLLEPQGSSSNHFQLVRERLAQSYIFTKNYTKVLALYRDSKNFFSSDDLYYIAFAHSKLGQFDKAIETFELSLKSAEVPKTLHDETEFELGLAFFLWNKSDQAEKHFLIASQARQSRLRYLSQFYLARIAIAKDQPDRAEKILQSLDGAALPDILLKYELFYLHGEAAFQLAAYPSAVNYFESALPQNFPENMPWYKEARYFLGLSYLRMGEDRTFSEEERRKHLIKAEEVLKPLLQQFSEERILLALGQCYLARARGMKDQGAYKQAEALLRQDERVISPKSRAHALLLLAEAAPTYEARDALYSHLTRENGEGSLYGEGIYAKSWYLRALNDFEEGMNQHALRTSWPFFEQSESSFKKAFDLLYPEDKSLAANAFKYRIQACLYLNSRKASAEAAAAMAIFLKEHKDLLQIMEDPDEIFYLYALALSNEESNRDQSLSRLQELLARYPNGRFADKGLHLLGTIYFLQNRFAEAEEAFVKLENEFRNSPLAGEALLWAARCTDKSSDVVKSKKYRQQAFERYPESPCAAEAYFLYYSYGDYLQGERAAIKHLQAMPEKYPSSPYVIHAWYLLGLDSRRDRKTEAGKWIRKRNLMAAIDAFQGAETAFDTLFKKGVLLDSQLDILTAIRYRAVLERAITNLEVADESQGAKKQIYLEYAEEVLRQIVEDFRNDQHFLRPHLAYVESNEHLEEEASQWLTEAYLRTNKDMLAEQNIAQMLEKYRSAKITRGYFLSRAYYNQGLIAARRKEHAQALQCFKDSEDAAKGNVISTEQKLDLWIQQSLCHQALNDLDNAILILSKAINDDAVSSLRIKAMYVRAEAYEVQGRRDLARKQLEAVAQKRGEWAAKAQEKLNKEYGYQ